MSIKQLYNELDTTNDFERNYKVYGWVRTCRTSSSILGFCNLNDGSNPEGLQIVISDKTMKQENLDDFFKDVKTGVFINCIGKMIKSPAEGQKYEMQLEKFELTGKVDDSYPLSKTKMNLDTLRNYIHLRARTNTFGSIFRIRSSLMKYLHDFYHKRDFLHLDPNVITVNECEGGAGVFQLTEKDITNTSDLKLVKDTKKYDWSTDHFCRPAYLTVSSQLQLETMACALGNVYTMNKSFRSEHSSTSKHVSEFTHLEIEMVNNTFDELMDIGESMIKYVINRLLNEKRSDMENLNKFISKGLIDKLIKLKENKFIKIKYKDVINEINEDILINKNLKLSKLSDGDDLGSEHENYITQKYDTGVFVTHWPIAIKSFYMKQCGDGTCESFDLLIPYGIGELIGASQREEDLDKLSNMMDQKEINKDDLSFYLDLRKYGTCPHGGFGLGFDRLLMLVTGMQNIKDVIPFPVYYKSCKF
jgi:asparaginyl-tRNA synthetase